LPPSLETIKRQRARAILEYFEGKSTESIIERANVSKVSVKKWVLDFQRSGLEGWRAYHTSPDRIFAHNPELKRSVKIAIKKIRKRSPKYKLAQNGNKRSHMNEYLRKLIEGRKFGNFSVRELIAKVEKKLGTGIGTEYVGDLLAICDVVLSRKQKAKRSRRAIKTLH
jgi:hypothetical protein